MARESSGKRVRFAESRSTSSNIDGIVSSSAVYSGNGIDGEYDNDVGDELAADITTGRRRRKINLDGYGSDASDQDEVGNLSDISDEEEGKQEVWKSDEDHEDEDMFTDEVGNSAGGSSAMGDQATDKKRKRRLDAEDAERQEADSALPAKTDRIRYTDRKGKSPDYANANGLESEDETKLEPLNMEGNLEEGKFDAQGNFIWNKKDPQAYQDDWLQGLSSDAIEKAKDSKEKQDKQQLANERDLSKRWDSISNDDIIVAVINMLQPRETVLNALARIGGPKKKAKKRWGKKAANKASGNATDADSAKEAERKKKIDELTELADQAMARGMVNIYEDTYEQFVRQMRVTGRIHDDWQPGEALSTAVTPDNPTVNGNAVEDGGGLLDDLDDFGQTY
ncbi:hypothetical protein GGI12_000783 [Dipsacomyces acuminosporus]|nr:hypothetical protein GGI12_000783 [Dipsacomyces acuminosporus]